MSDKSVDERRKALNEQIEAEKGRIKARYQRQTEAMQERMAQELEAVDKRFDTRVTQLERAARVAGNLASKSVH